MTSRRAVSVEHLPATTAPFPGTILRLKYEDEEEEREVVRILTQVLKLSTLLKVPG